MQMRAGRCSPERYGIMLEIKSNQIVRLIWLARRALLVIAPSLLLASCCQHPWNVHSMPEAPTRSCHAAMSGQSSGFVVHIWECVNNQRVVIYGAASEGECMQAQNETVACGELSTIEKNLGDEVASGCKQAPAESRWQTGS